MMDSVKQINKHVPMIRFLGKRIFEQSKNDSTILLLKTSIPPIPLLNTNSSMKSSHIRSNSKSSTRKYLRETLSSHEMETIEVSFFLYRIGVINV